MANSDKVRSAFPLIRMLKAASSLTFQVDNSSDLFVTINGIKLFEVDRMPDAVAMVNSLNLVVTPVIEQFIDTYEKRIGTLIA